MKFKFTVKKADITKAYEEVLQKAVANTTLKGFRKGKAPKKMVEEKVGQNELQKQAIEFLLPAVYIDEVKKRKLNPISYPQINPITVEKNGDWVFEADVIEKPEVKLGDYKKYLKGAAAKTKLWTPDKQEDPNDNAKKTPQQVEDEKLKIVFDLLLEKTSVEVPKLLVKREVDRMLTTLLEQVNKLGLKIDDYLQTMNKTKESIRADYEKTAQDNIKLEFVLGDIAADLKVQVPDEEIDHLINSLPDEKLKQKVQNSAEERLNVRLALIKRKTVAQLLKIAS